MRPTYRCVYPVYLVRLTMTTAVVNLPQDPEISHAQGQPALLNPQTARIYVPGPFAFGISLESLERFPRRLDLCTLGLDGFADGR